MSSVSLPSESFESCSLYCFNKERCAKILNITVFVVAILFFTASITMHCLSVNAIAVNSSAAIGGILWLSLIVIPIIQNVLERRESNKNKTKESVTKNNFHSSLLNIDKPVSELYDGLAALNQAASSGNVDSVIAILNKGVMPTDISMWSALGSSFLALSQASVSGAVKNGDNCNTQPQRLRIIRAFLEKNPQLAECPLPDPVVSNLTPLHRAVCQNCPELVQLLIDYGADVNAQQTVSDWYISSCTPLLLTFLSKIIYNTKHSPNIEIIEILTKAGADPEIKTGGGATIERCIALYWVKWAKENKERLDKVKAIWASKASQKNEKLENS